MKYKYLILIVLFGLGASHVSCRKHKSATIKIKAVSIVGDSTIAGYYAFASDTVWGDMLLFVDSLRKTHPPGMEIVIGFMYPEDAIDEFKPGTLANKRKGNKNSYLLARYSSLNDTVIFEKFPDSFVLAKQSELDESEKDN